MEEHKALINKPTTTEIEALLKDPTELVYIQFSSSGAMGYPGEVVLGEQGQDGLIIHHFNHNYWDKDDLLFVALMDRLYQFVLKAPRSANPTSSSLDSNPAPKNEHYRTAGGMGNHVLLNPRYEFELGENCIYWVADNIRTPLLLTSLPITSLGPQLFPNSFGADERPNLLTDPPFNLG